MEEMQKELFPFGKKVSIGNFYFVKTNRTLSGKELKALRSQSGIPSSVQKYLHRGGLPYITISTIGGGWNISFVCGCSMANFIEYEYSRLDDGGQNALLNLFTLMYADTSLLGDNEYVIDKGNAYKAYMERIGRGTEETSEEKAEDDKILAQVKAEENMKEAVIGLGEQIVNEINNGEQQND